MKSSQRCHTSVGSRGNQALRNRAVPMLPRAVFLRNNSWRGNRNYLKSRFGEFKKQGRRPAENYLDINPLKY